MVKDKSEAVVVHLKGARQPSNQCYSSVFCKGSKPSKELEWLYEQAKMFS